MQVIITTNNNGEKIEYHREMPEDLVSKSVVLTNCFSENWLCNNIIELPCEINVYDDFINYYVHNIKSNSNLANLLFLSVYFQIEEVEKVLIQEIEKLVNIYEIYENMNILLNFDVNKNVISKLLNKLELLINNYFSFRTRNNYIINNNIAMLMNMPCHIVLEYCSLNNININFLAEWYECNLEKLNILDKENLIIIIDNIDSKKLIKYIDVEIIMQSKLYSDSNNLAHKILETQLDILKSFNRIENKYNNFSVNITIPGLVQNARAKIVDILNSEDQVLCVNIKY
jgi:hypothetical protein